MSTSSFPEAEWVLKRYFISTILDTFHLVKQQRKPKSAKKFADKAREKIENGNLATAQSLVDKGFKEDLLSPEVFIAQTNIAEAEKNLKELIFCQLAVALVTHDIHWWAMASLNSMNKESGSVVQMLELIRGGYDLFSTRFVDYSRKLLEEQKEIKPDQIEIARLIFRLILDPEYTLANAREDGIPIPEEIEEDVLNFKQKK